MFSGTSSAEHRLAPRASGIMQGAGRLNASLHGFNDGAFGTATLPLNWTTYFSD